MYSLNAKVIIPNSTFAWNSGVRKVGEVTLEACTNHMAIFQIAVQPQKFLTVQI